MSSASWSLLLGDDAVVAGEHHVLVAACESRALEPERLAEPPLHPVGHLGACLPSRARQLQRHGAQELDPVRRHRVGEEHDGVEALVPARRRAVQRRHLRVQRHGLHVVGELREQRAEPQKVRLPARGALGAHRQVAPGQHAGHGLGVAGAVARQPHRLDGRDHLREAAEAVGHGGDGALQRRRQHDGVHQRAVRAHVQHVLPPQRRFRAEAGDAEADAEEGAGDEVERVREDDADVDTDHGEDDAQREEEEEGERGGRGGEERQAPVVEDERLRVLVPRQLGALCALSAHHVHFLQQTNTNIGTLLKNFFNDEMFLYCNK
ncbi:hypothetical protein PR202_ga10402 [Eleusine coracana subsp. coracana]|uniref:Uncharacterized protein n=1 Tax=Eleusine coracana subsp. coracana TaxID=191504 RepID=A0AAV5C6Q7_ELECO|nr:hypothetical protein PR202_ga10402 [Eleusine coracana subsp. coracana]